MRPLKTTIKSKKTKKIVGCILIIQFICIKSIVKLFIISLNVVPVSFIKFA